MTKEEQIVFVNELLDSISKDIRAAVVHKVPPHWGGVQLRQYIADQFVDRCDAPRYLRRTDVRDYEHDVVQFNL